MCGCCSNFQLIAFIRILKRTAERTHFTFVLTAPTVAGGCRLPMRLLVIYGISGG